MQRTHLFIALALIAATAIGVARLGGRPSEPAATAAAPPAIRVEASGEGSRGEVLVHVAGAVRRPGVYRLREGMRIDDALRLAGGPKRRADLSAVNLAAKVQDGRQVLVPGRARAGAPAGASASGATGEAGGGAAALGAPVNLNTATIEQLDALEGIGPATAQSILDYREEHGGFGSVEELGQIPGIGEKRLATLREGVTV